jgi:ABC-type uncharacterized transport system substrate-binding protein
LRTGSRCRVSGGLEKLGWAEGRGLNIQYRWFAGDPERACAYAAELVQFKPDVIFAGATPSLAALERETRSVPITGFAAFEYAIASWLELLKQIAP